CLSRRACAAGREKHGLRAHLSSRRTHLDGRRGQRRAGRAGGAVQTKTSSHNSVAQGDAAARVSGPPCKIGEPVSVASLQPFVAYLTKGCSADRSKCSMRVRLGTPEPDQFCEQRLNPPSEKLPVARINNSQGKSAPENFENQPHPEGQRRTERHFTSAKIAARVAEFIAQVRRLG